MIVLGLTETQAEALYDVLVECEYGNDDIIDTIIETLEEKIKNNGL